VRSNRANTAMRCCELVSGLCSINIINYEVCCAFAGDEQVILKRFLFHTE
jgi:hypothetical protein